MTQDVGIAISALAAILVLACGVLIWRIWLREVQPQQRSIVKIKEALKSMLPTLQLQGESSDLLYKFAELCVNLHEAERQLGLYAREEAIKQCQDELEELEELVKALPTITEPESTE